jgi:hypothetical protein
MRALHKALQQQLASAQIHPACCVLRQLHRASSACTQQMKAVEHPMIVAWHTSEPQSLVELNRGQRISEYPACVASHVSHVMSNLALAMFMGRHGI